MQSLLRSLRPVQSTVRRAWVPTLAITLATFGLTGCGDDATSSFGVTMVASPTNLPADGSRSAELSISVLSAQDSSPPSIGSLVTIQCVNAETGEPTGNLSGTGGAIAQLATNSSGIASTTLACNGEAQLICLADFDGDRGRLETPITCEEVQPVTCAIESISPSPLPPGEDATIVVEARLTENGDPAPRGTVCALRVGNGEGTFRNGRDATTVTTGDNRGRASTLITAGDTPGLISICAISATQGATESCRTVRVSEASELSAACICSTGNSRIPADGTTETAVQCAVSDSTGSLVAGTDVNFSARIGTFLDGPGGDPVDEPTNETIVTTSEQGEAQTVILSPSQPGSALLSAETTITDSGVETELECVFSEDIVFFEKPTCTFEGMTPDLLGVDGSGFNESGLLEYCFVDVDGNAVPLGTRIDFDLITTLPGVSLSTSTATSDETGCVKVSLSTGPRSGQVEVRATMPFGVNESTCTSGPLSIRGTRPTHEGWVFSCTSRNVGARIDVDEILQDDILLDVPIGCTTRLRDRFGNPIPFDTAEVFFMSEQGNIVSPQAPTEQGDVTTTYNTLGAAPDDVDPVEGEPFVQYAGFPNLANPRDNMVTIVAWTQGEEGFDDVNGNGEFDEGIDKWVDLGEPYIDANDSGAWEDGEVFIDIETPTREINGIYDGPNGQWDENTVIWTETRVILSAFPRFGTVDELGGDAGASNPDVLSHWIIDDLSFRGPRQFVPGDTFSLPESGTFSQTTIARDPWMNLLGGATSVAHLLTCPPGVDAEISTSSEPLGADRYDFQVGRERVAYVGEGPDARRAGPGVRPSDITHYRMEVVHDFPNGPEGAGAAQTVFISFDLTTVIPSSSCAMNTVFTISPVAGIGPTITYTNAYLIRM